MSDTDLAENGDFELAPLPTELIFDDDLAIDNTPLRQADLAGASSELGLGISATRDAAGEEGTTRDATVEKANEGAGGGASGAGSNGGNQSLLGEIAPLPTTLLIDEPLTTIASSSPGAQLPPPDGAVADTITAGTDKPTDRKQFRVASPPAASRSDNGDRAQTASSNPTSDTPSGKAPMRPPSGSADRASANDLSPREAIESGAATLVPRVGGSIPLTEEALTAASDTRGEGKRDGLNADAQGKHEADASSANSSPLSSLPDLPTEPLDSPVLSTAGVSMHPPQLFLSPETPLNRFGDGDMMAESSAQAVAQGKRKAAAQGGGRTKSSKTASSASLGQGEEGTGKTKGKGKANKAMGAPAKRGQGFSQEDAIDIDGKQAEDDDEGDDDYRPGGASKGKAKKAHKRRGNKRQVLEFFGRAAPLKLDGEGEDMADDVMELDEDPLGGRHPLLVVDSPAAAVNPPTQPSSPYETPEPIEYTSAPSRPARADTSAAAAARDHAATPPGDAEDGQEYTRTGRPARASARAGATGSTGATLTPIAAPERKSGNKVIKYSETQIKAKLRGRLSERQMATCQRPRYAKWGKCTQCVAKAGGDSCRFREFRVFPIDPLTAEITGPGYFRPYKLTEDITPLPTEFNVPFDEQHILRTEKTVAPILLPLITRELRHIVKNKAIKREVDAAKHRSVCDFCQSTIFAGYFFCRLCGKDYCLSCERFFSDNSETMDRSPWHIFDAARPRLMHCSARAGKSGDGGRLEAGPRTYGNADAEAGADLNVNGDAGQDQGSGSGAGAGKPADGFLTSPSIPDQAQAGHTSNRVLEGASNPSTPATGHTGAASPAADPSSSTAKPKARTSSAQAAAGTTTKSGSGLPGVPRPKQIKWHFRPDLQPVSRFDEDEIRRHWLDLAGYGVKGDEGDWRALFGLGELEAMQVQVAVDKAQTGRDGTEGENGDVSERALPVTGADNAQIGEAGARVGDGQAEDANGGPQAVDELDVKRLIEDIETLRRHLEELADKAGREQKELSKRKAALESSDPSIPEPALAPASAGSDIDPALLYTRSTHPTAPLPSDPADLQAESHPFLRIHVDQLDNATFDSLWSRGEPMVVDGIEKRLKEKWNPDGMIDLFGDEACGVTNCETDVAWASTVRDFFEAFKNREGRGKGIWKLKDWPATEDFKQTHPTLYNDFSDALPVPDYTRREGALNLYAHFPPGSSRPDIGPKMYNAFAARENKGGQGSTRLHMDVADAINVMLYSSPLDVLAGQGKKEVKREEGEREVVDLTGEGGGDGRGGSRVDANGVMENEPHTVDAEKLHTGDNAKQDAQAAGNEDREMAQPAKVADKSPDKRALPAADATMTRDGPSQLVTSGNANTGASIKPDEGEGKIKDGTRKLASTEPGCAVWDIFRAEDADKIRTYLSRKFGSKHVFVDPIHAQMFFLDASMRRELWDKYGVVSHRIYQYPGQAVFIPAGCAHQVCNLADCIKIALDFVSPQNVRRCQQLTQDFRNENFVKAWKEDVLQLYNILWFAWMSARETRDRRAKETTDRKTQDAQHLADIADAQRKARNGTHAMVSSARDEPTARDDSPAAAADKSSAPVASEADASKDASTSTNGDLAKEQESVQEEQNRLVARLLAAALAAPDAPPPPEARAPSAATGSRWAHAKAAASAAAAHLIQRNTRPLPAKNGQTSSAATPSLSRRGPGARERIALLERSASADPASLCGPGNGHGTAGELVGEGGRGGNRYTDMIKDGSLPMAVAFDGLRSEMGNHAGLKRAVEVAGVEADVGEALPFGEHPEKRPRLAEDITSAHSTSGDTPDEEESERQGGDVDMTV